MLVKYFFRGTWCPACRNHLVALQEQYGAMKAAGIEVVAITAEPGGEEVVRERLVKREVPTLDFKVISDPEHKELQNMPDIFVFIDFDIKTYKEPNEHYKVIQPALVVIDDNGNIMPELNWSWKTMGFPDGKWDDRVDTQPWEGPVKQVLLVTFRPLMSDLLSAIQEKRPVKLASTNREW